MNKKTQVQNADQTLSGIATLLQPLYPGLTGNDVHAALDAYVNRKDYLKVSMREPRLLTRKEVAERLKVSLATVNRMFNDGRLRRTRLGSRRLVRVPEESIQAFIANHSVEVYDEC